ncbi:MFS transporter [Nocardioides sp.]|uniref:MFS transporter n=1 Tax=Nocardioides sp. TaxID=35761 RepID=UPI000C95DEF6|nr:MFS transporter [Nocardioides sp.]MAS55618.1 MFS transporter [Pimelobacter sp.]MDE0777471.1 MFS transporter [Nocardioides sp.]
MTWAESLAPLRERNFRFYYASRVVNMMGNAMASVALAFAVLKITDDDPAALGFVLAAHSIPMVLLLLWGGVIADRFPRNVVIQVSNIASAITQGLIAALVITGLAELWMLVALSVVHGIVSAVSFPAMASIMPQLVPRGELQRSNALMSLARSALTILGPTLSALLVVGVGPGWALAVDASTWLVSAVLLGFVVLPERAPKEQEAGTIAELREGWTYFRRTTWLWVVVLGFGVLNAIHMGAWFTLGPARAKDTIGEQGWGLVLSAEAIGLLVMTLVMLRVPLQRPLLHGMLGISLLGVPILILGAHPHLAILMIATFVAGAGTEVFSMGWNLAMQEHVPDEMLSRAYSYDALGSFVAIPVGQIAFGPLAVAFGFTDVLIVSGVVYVVVCLLVLLSSSVRRLPRLVSTEVDAGVSTTSAPEPG